MHTLKLTQIDDAVGMILPDEVLSRMKLELGDTLYVTETANGFVLTPYDPSFPEQVAAAAGRKRPEDV